MNILGQSVGGLNQLAANYLRGNDQAGQGESASRASSSGASNANAAKFDTWFRSWSSENEGFAVVDNVKKLREEFLAIQSKAEAANASKNPVAFIKSLSTAELGTLQTIHRLADPIDPSNLSVEGAYNLLQTPDYARDLDGDGRYLVGAASTFIFPGADAPALVKSAWNAVISGKSELTVALMKLSLASEMQTNTGNNRPYASEAQSQISSVRNSVSSILASLNDADKYNTSQVSRENLNAVRDGFSELLAALSPSGS